MIWRDSHPAVWVLRNIQMQDLPRVTEDHASVQQARGGGNHHEHVDGDDALDLIAQENPPSR